MTAKPSLRLPPPPDGKTDLLVIAGEHSGDEHAARLVRGLLARRPDLRIRALGGPRLAASGAELLLDLTASSVIGYAGVLRRYFSYFRPLFHETVRWIGEHRPGAVCFVDYGGFNLRLAAALRNARLTRKGGGPIKALYYISPQIWASRGGRRFAMAQDLDALAVIFPFEPRCHDDTALPVEFVGHPFAAPDYQPPVRYDPAGPVLLLPGSRKQPVSRLFPVFLEAWRSLGAEGIPGAVPTAVVLYPSEEIVTELRRHLSGADAQDARLLSVSEGDPVGACAVLTSSGTMSLHCALAGIPGAVAYRTDALTYWLGRRLVTVSRIGIANLLLEEAMYPEFIQGAATPAALGAELRACVVGGERRAKAAEQAARLKGLLSQPAGHSAVDWLERQLAIPQ